MHLSVSLLAGMALLAGAPRVAAAAASPTAALRYTIETVAGSDTAGDGGPAVAAQLNRPQGIAPDRKGNLYIADTENHRVRKISPAGVITTIAGDGHEGMRGDGGPGEFARLNLPFGVAVDGQGNVYIADLGNHRVRRVAANGVITTVAGTGEKGSGGDGGPATAAQLMSPRNVALDASGNLYISEFEGHRVRKVSPGGTITTVAGLGIAGMGGDGGPAVKAQLAYPAGLAVDGAGTLYVADSQNHRVRRITPDGTISSQLGGTDAVTLMTPVGVAVDAAGNLYVAERTPMIRRFTPAGRMWNVAGSTMPGYDGDGRPATTSFLLAPADVALDEAGNLYIADGPRIRRVDPRGILSTVAGDAYTKNIGDLGPAVQAQLNSPQGMAMDIAGNLYIADTGTHRIRKVTVAGTILTVAGTGLANFSGDGRPAELCELNAPAGVSLDGSGNLLIADTGNNRVRLVTAAGIIRTVAGSGGTGLGGDGLQATFMPLHAPTAALADARGNLYIADTRSHRVLVSDPAGIIATAAGNGSGGYSGDAGSARQAQLRQPSGMALDAAGNLYFADALNNRIRKVAPDGIVTTVVGNGAAAFAGDGGAAAEASLNQPRGVAVDGDGNLYIADTGNHAVRKVTAAGVVHTIAGTGVVGFGGDGAAAKSAGLNAPAAVLLDGMGNVYVADTGNHRVRKLTPATDTAPTEYVEEARVLSAASLLPGPVAPGEIVSIFAFGIAPEKAESGSLDQAGSMRTEVAGIEALFDGTPAPLFSVQAGEVKAQVPYTVAGRGITAVEVRQRNILCARTSVQVIEAAPALFTAGGGSGQALAVNEDGSFNAPANPADRGSLVTFYATGEGRLEPSALTGSPARAPYGKPALPVSMTVGGYQTEIVWAGAAPGAVGLMQINARLPAGFVPTGVLPVELTVGGGKSQPGVTIALK